MVSKAESRRRWAAKNKPYLAAKSARWRKNHPELHKENQKKYKGRYKDRLRVACRKWHLKTNYGLTLEQYSEMFLAQNGVCAVCHNPDTGLRRGTVKSLDVDHNHKTNEVRGLLCSACNASLGLLKEDPLRIRALATYIERY
jgi:hypothetical protein